MTVALGWAAFKVIRVAQRSVMMHKNPAYMLYSDSTCLNKSGFLYVQYRATAYYFVLPVLAYILAKSCFIAFAQSAKVAQAIGLVIVEAVALIAVSVLRPWMDKKTNIFNISIAAINFLNVVFLLVFTGVFGQPAIVNGIMGVLFALFNVIFAAVLLVLVLIASIYAITLKNPDTRYQPMRDDRGSFIRSQSALMTELDALGATARGDTKEIYGKERAFGDDDAPDSDSLNRQPTPASAGDEPLRPTTHDRMAENLPMYPSEHAGRRGPNTNSYDSHSAIIDSYDEDPNANEYHSGYNSPAQRMYQGNNNGSHQQTPSANSSPWQRGAGYD